MVKWIKPHMLLKKYWVIPVHDRQRSVRRLLGSSVLIKRLA